MHPISQRPQSLLEVAERAHSLESWGLALGELLDEINFRRENLISFESCVHSAPRLLQREFPGGEIADAFGAGFAEYVAAEFLHRIAPAWTTERERFLPVPWYPDDSPQIRAYLDHTAPRAFRDHGVFLDIDSLVRV